MLTIPMTVVAFSLLVDGGACVGLFATAKAAGNQERWRAVARDYQDVGPRLALARDLVKAGSLLEAEAKVVVGLHHVLDMYPWAELNLMLAEIREKRGQIAAAHDAFAAA